jgi:hypothetical protein
MTRVRAMATAGVVFALMAMGAPPAQARTAVECTVAAGVTITPGITATQPRKGTFTSKAGSTVTCTGIVANKRVSGKGPLSFSGSYGNVGRGDTCAAGSGIGKFSASVPLANNPATKMTFSGTFAFKRVGGDVTLTGTATSPERASVAGQLNFQPDRPTDCATPLGVRSAKVSGPVTAFKA